MARLVQLVENNPAYRMREIRVMSGEGIVLSTSSHCTSLGQTIDQSEETVRPTGGMKY